MIQPQMQLEGGLLRRDICPGKDLHRQIDQRAIQREQFALEPEALARHGTTGLQSRVKQPEEFLEEVGVELLVPTCRGRTADRAGVQVIAQRGIVHQCGLDIAQAVPLAHMPDHQCQKLAPAGKGIAAARAIELRRQSLEFKSRYALEKLTEYSRTVGHSPIPRFDSPFCADTIGSKTAQESAMSLN